MITQEQISNLVNDVSYLGDEAEALSYVIESIPYDKKPASGERSIVETLLYLDHAQQNYYRPIIEDVLTANRPININAYTEPETSFEVDPEKLKDVQKLLFKIGKHRAALLNLIEKRPVIDWEKEITVGKGSKSLFTFVSEMVKKERTLLKEMAELILAYQSDQQFQREVEKRQPG